VYWYKRNAILFIGGLLGFFVTIIILIIGKAKGIFFHNIEGFEARLLAILLMIVCIFLMSSILFNKKDKDLSLPGLIMLLGIGPFLELLAHSIALWLGK
jgi:hypothetical protein